jgi:FkbH-like protein
MKEEKVTAIITDLDGCLWREILAEKQKLSLNQDYFSHLKELYKKGIQVFVVSKNDSNEIHNAFDLLGINNNIFTHVISNWEPKYLNIERLIHQTHIRPETIIFIDDNFLELNEVKLMIPEIICVDFSKWTSILNSQYFKSLKQQSTFEIQERVNRYRTSIYSFELRNNIKEDSCFLKLLNRKLSIGEISSEIEIERFAKLLAMTHRINFNPEKFQNSTEALSSLNEKGILGYKLIGVSVWESDLSLGLSGGFVIKLTDSSAYIEDATFSCGIIGRDFEQKAILELVYCLKKIGVKKVVFYVKLTSSNIRVSEILNELEFQKVISGKRMAIFTLNIENYNPLNRYDWIEIIEIPSFSEHAGIPIIIDFFFQHVISKIKENNTIINLGSAKGEVLGLLQPEKRITFNKFLEHFHASLTKVDLEYIPEEQNTIGNAENLKDIINNETFDLVMAIELLEHTQHFWKVIDEMIRICKVGGHIFITIPAFNYPKHEYPIDLWRIGPSTLLSFFPEDKFEIVKFTKEGDSDSPRRLMLLVRKKTVYCIEHGLPKDGKTDWKTGITYFK